MDEMRSRYQIVHGRGDARGLTAGSLFTLTDYPRSDQNREYLITATSCQASSNKYGSGGGEGGGDDFTCSFAAISSAQQIRPPRVTPLPGGHGPQTALVAGPRRDESDSDGTRRHRDRVRLG